MHETFLQLVNYENASHSARHVPCFHRLSTTHDTVRRHDDGRRGEQVGAILRQRLRVVEPFPEDRLLTYNVEMELPDDSLCRLRPERGDHREPHTAFLDVEVQQVSRDVFHSLRGPPRGATVCGLFLQNLQNSRFLSHCLFPWERGSLLPLLLWTTLHDRGVTRGSLLPLRHAHQTTLAHFTRGVKLPGR